MNDYNTYKDLGIGFPENIEALMSKPPKHDEFAVISPCFYEEETKMISNSKQLFQNDGVKYITYGEGETFTNKAYTNLIRLYEKLNEIEDQFDTVLIMDAYDVLYLGGRTVLMTLSKYRTQTKEKPTVILASEKNCYPNGCDIFYDNKQEKYLNSGLMIGPSNLIKVMIREMIQNYDLLRFETGNDDPLDHSQIYWHRYFNEGKLKENLRVDLNNEYFFCMDSCDPYLELEIDNSLKIRVKKTNTFPKFFHFNRCYFKEYKYLFGEFWVEKLGKS